MNVVPSLLRVFVLSISFVAIVGNSSVFGQAVADAVAATPPKATPTDSVPTALHDYVARPEPDFAWKVVRRLETPAGKLTELRLTSQKWHDIVWQHAVEIFEPKTLKFPSHALLFVTGGSQPPKSADAGTIGMGTALAETSGMRVVVLHQVPNQPLFDGRKEDDLITETWLKYLEDGDETWPLLFPMVKSAVKTMDAVQQLSKDEYSTQIDSFVITGASKRGWTSWLTPVADKRIAATAPIVIDTLNFRAQMQHQLDTWGSFSVQIKDYSSKGLIVLGEESKREKHLRLMMDPYTYREQLTLPKLLVNGTNDPYWVVDAMSKYWDDLKGPKYIIQLPNDGHGLKGGREKALRTVGAFARMNADGQPLPKLQFSCDEAADRYVLSVVSDTAPESVFFWRANSTDLDFRDDQWESQEMAASEDGSFHQNFAAEGHTAVFAELIFKTDGVPYSLCTLIYRR
ncbi:PhoPQ-activated pathogenicity-related family protein [Fuerstiella marisgermanici]|uniref:PhoPQ-activated pathogenicity-related protein n=1 Tax=Fuerstiella marisgermanici TaxID=1891926 RepID=A0A1P8WG76_9PLAN|nr:PhoPQ-activated protein PqaA family protein [Fuerstiella marisgermanici]APZ93058.1 PhoPQ-activated pathogenicity-related protein [Fuerstiella marisgermanici]